MSDRARVGMTVTNAQTGEPLEVDADITQESIVLRIGDSITAVHHRALTPQAALVLADQLTRSARGDG